MQPIHNRAIETVTIDRRFQGTPGAANGGFVSGLLAERLGGSAEVTLRRPAPVDSPIVVKNRGCGAWLEAGGEVLVAARSSRFELELPIRPSFEEATWARDRFDARRLPHPQCFVCGHQRQCADGLRIFAGPISEGVVAAPWVPDRSLSEAGEAGEPGDEVSTRFVWAALDCPGGFAASGGRKRPMTLCHIAGRQERPVHVGEPCVVLAWHRATAGRRHEVGTAILDARGSVAARSIQTWVEDQR